MHNFFHIVQQFFFFYVVFAKTSFICLSAFIISKTEKKSLKNQKVLLNFAQFLENNPL